MYEITDTFPISARLTFDRSTLWRTFTTQFKSVQSRRGSTRDYRLKAFTITLPALRMRRADIVPLAEHFRCVCANRDKVPASAFSDDALIALQQYSYPGNVRELEHIVERALLQSQGRLILPEHLQLQRTVDNSNAHWIEGLTALPLHDSVAEWEKFRISKAFRGECGEQS
jgi:DNA-binding NtrC family response regulator